MFSDWLNKAPGSKKAGAIPFLKKGKTPKQKNGYEIIWFNVFYSPFLLSYLPIYCTLILPFLLFSSIPTLLLTPSFTSSLTLSLYLSLFYSYCHTYLRTVHSHLLFFFNHTLSISSPTLLLLSLNLFLFPPLLFSLPSQMEQWRQSSSSRIRFDHGVCDSSVNWRENHRELGSLIPD